MDSSPERFHITRAPLATAVELVEFGDPLCSRSQVMRKTICTTIALFKDQGLSHVYRHYPDPHTNESLLAAVAIEAAGRQGKFWSMYSALLNQSPINGVTLAALALTLELDQHQFMHDLLDDRSYSVIKTDWRVGYSLGVRFAPTLFIDGQQFHGKLTQARLVPIIQFHLNNSRHSI